MDFIDEASIISQYIKRFREQPPSSSEQRKQFINQNTKRQFWWQLEDKEGIVRTSVNTAISELSISRIIEEESSLKDSHFSIEFFNDSQVNLDDYTNRLLSKCDELLKDYMIEPNIPTDYAVNKSKAECDSLSSSSSSDSLGTSSSSSSASSEESMDDSLVNHTLQEPNRTQITEHKDSYVGNLTSVHSESVKMDSPLFIIEQSLPLEISESISVLSPQLIQKKASPILQLLTPPKINLEYNDNVSNSSMYLSPYSLRSLQNSTDEKDFCNNVHIYTDTSDIKGSDIFINDKNINILSDTHSGSNVELNNAKIALSKEVVTGVSKDNNGEDECGVEDSLCTIDSVLCGIRISHQSVTDDDDYTLQGNQNYVNLDLVSPYLSDELISYMWNRLCIVKQQIVVLES